MQEKILAKLKTQRGTTSKVSDRSLEDLAKSLTSIITTDEVLAVADLTAAINSIDGNINNYTAAQIKALNDAGAAADQAKKAKEDAEKKAAEDLAKGIKPTIDPVIEELMKQNKLIMEQLQGFATEKVSKSRSEILNEKLKDTPLMFKESVLSNFKRAAFKDDEDFGSYLSEIEAQAKSAIQVGREKGLNTATPSAQVQKPESEELSPIMKAAYAAYDDANKQ